MSERKEKPASLIEKEEEKEEAIWILNEKISLPAKIGQGIIPQAKLTELLKA